LPDDLPGRNPSECYRLDFVDWPFGSRRSRVEPKSTAMREQVLRQFFEGKSSATELARDISGSTKQSTPTVSMTFVEDMDSDFRVTCEMGVALCEAVLSGDLPAESLRTIGFALEASDRFHWDGDEDEVLASVIADWSCPEINYPLTIENVARFRAWLMRIEPYPPKGKPASTKQSDRLISVHEKKRIRRNSEMF